MQLSNDLINLYLALFYDSFLSSFLLGFQNKLILPTILYFSKTNKSTFLIIDNFAVICGYLANYLMGVMLYKIYLKITKSDLDFIEQRFIYLRQKLANNWFYFCTSAILPPLDSAITCLLGFVKLNRSRTLMIFFTSNFVSYITLLL